MRVEDFFDIEAIESEDDLSDNDLRTSKRRRLSSSEEESEDEDKIREEMKDLINDSEEDEYESEPEQLSSDGLDDEIMEDDILLLEENTGRKFDRKKLLKRVKIGSDDEVEGKLTQNSGNENKKRKITEFDDGDDMDDFVVDEYGKPCVHGNDNLINDEQLVEAQQIFGVDYDSDVEDTPADHSAEKQELTKSIDLPERFIGKSMVSMSPEDLEKETAWIYRHAFSKAPLSRMTCSVAFSERMNKYSAEEFTIRIKNVLDLIHNSKVEVPFIAVYRKELFSPVLDEDSLWTVCDWDDEWRHFVAFRSSIVTLFCRMKQFLGLKFENGSLNCRDITDNLIKRYFGSLSGRIEWAENELELKDWHAYFMLHYGHEIQSMNDYFSDGPKIKSAIVRNTHRMCVDDGLGDIVKMCGLSSDNIDAVVKGELEFAKIKLDETQSPSEIAVKYTGRRHGTVKEVLKAVKYMLSMEIASEPSLIRYLRTVMYPRGVVSVRLTPSGLREMDEGHPCYSMRYLKDKPLTELEDECFLCLTSAETDGLIKLIISFDETNGTSEQLVTSMFCGEDNEWSSLRRSALANALSKIIFPKILLEIKQELVSEASNSVIKKCCDRLNGMISGGPYFGCVRTKENKSDNNVMAIAYTSSRDNASFAAVVDIDGEVVEVLKLPFLVEGRFSPFQDHKKSTLNKLAEFIDTHKPSMIVVSTEDRLATFVVDDVRLAAKSVDYDVDAELFDNELSKIYSFSRKSETELGDYPVICREAISLARLLVDPVAEYSQLVNKQEDYLSFQYHNMQNHVNRDILGRELKRQVISFVNRTGVDINRARHFPHVFNLLQFVGGLGPKKAEIFMKDEYRDVICRTELVTNYKIGPTVFVNCSGFLLINQYYCVNNGLYSDQFEPLDYYRIHPEGYHWVRKMVIDALDYEDDRDADNSLIIDELMGSKDKLRDLDLEAFNAELEKQKFGKKIDTLLDIREQLIEEITEDAEFKRISNEDLFFKLLNESPESLYIGKLVTCRVIGYARKRPSYEQIRSVRPRKDPNSGSFECPFCRGSSFEDINEVKGHLKDCPGSAIGLRVAFDNGLVGFIHSRNVSDRRFDNLEKIKIGAVVSARVTSFDFKKIQCGLISKGSVLNDKGETYGVKKDKYYDYEAEEKVKRDHVARKKRLLKKGYVRRLIIHHNYKEVSYKKCCELLEGMEVGDCIFRPSSKGICNLTMSWKVADGIYSHVDIVESGKEIGDLRLGSVLKIDGEVFEDLDEIISRYLQSIVIYIRDIMNFQYFIDSDDGRQMERYLLAEKKRLANRIPYGLSLLKEYPCKAVVCYFVNNSVKKEYISVTWKGIKYKNRIFNSVKHAIDHFKAVLSGRL